MNARDAVRALDALDGNDPESAHTLADDIVQDVLFAIAPSVYSAYKRVQSRCDWWKTA